VKLLPFVMARSSIYVGLEIGTSKICVVVGEAKGDGAIKILGVGQAPSRGVRKGEIVDFETAHTCLHDALVRAEDRSDVMIRNVYLSITGSHVESVNNRGRIRIPDDQAEITEDDLAEVRDIARDVTIPQSNVLLHSMVRHYCVDGQDGVRNPLGMQAQVLDADFHVIHGMRGRIQNTIRCVREIPLEVEDVVFAPIASAQVVLSRQAKEDGALLIDVGGGTADYVVYRGGVVACSGCVGLGGDHITNDIALVLKVSQNRAEQLKVRYGSAVVEDAEAGEMVRLEEEAGYVGREVERRMLNDIIGMRVREIFEQVKRRADEDGLLSRLAGGVYLTGGTSLMQGIDRVAQEVLEMPAHRGNSPMMSGVTAAFENPQFATPIGLIRYAQLIDQERPLRSAIRRFGQRMADMVKHNRLSGFLASLFS